MFLKLELRSSLGWLLVRFMEPFSRRLRKPVTRKGVAAAADVGSMVGVALSADPGMLRRRPVLSGGDSLLADGLVRLRDRLR